MAGAALGGSAFGSFAPGPQAEQEFIQGCPWMHRGIFPLVLSIRLMATFGSDETSAIFISGIHTQRTGEGSEVSQAHG